jgi:hypothetical protein
MCYFLVGIGDQRLDLSHKIVSSGSRTDQQTDNIKILISGGTDIMLN